MSTEAGSRRAGSRARRRRAYLGGFAAVLLLLAVTGLAGAAAGATQGPRVTRVSVDAAAAVQASGSRLIVTTTQSLRAVRPAQVSVEPAAAFTVDTQGRSVGVRFTLPLHDDTRYTVRLREVIGVGGGPASILTQTFRTPALEVYLLRRAPSGDRIVRTDLHGAHPVTVLRNAHIEDFRATSSHLVALVVDGSGRSGLLVTDLDGRHPRMLRLPGAGSVSAVQSADRGELIGYLFSAADAASGGTTAALYVASLKDDAKDAAPTKVAVSGPDKRVADWHFVPDSDSILLLNYGGRVLLSGSTGQGAADLGTGVTIDGIARGSSTAVLERADGLYTVNLATGRQQPLVDPRGASGFLGTVTPLPGTGAGTVRPYTVVDDSGSTATTVYRVADSGSTRPLLQITPGDALLQTCAAPSGRYVAVLVAPGIVANAYDGYQLPMPKRVVTHIVDLSSGRQVSTLDGFDISWCQVPPVSM